MNIIYCVGHTAYKQGINSARFYSTKSAAIRELRNRYVPATKARIAIESITEKLLYQQEHGINFPRHNSEIWTETPDAERHVIELRAYMDEVTQ